MTGMGENETYRGTFTFKKMSSHNIPFTTSDANSFVYIYFTPGSGPWAGAY